MIILSRLKNYVLRRRRRKKKRIKCSLKWKVIQNIQLDLIPLLLWKRNGWDFWHILTLHLERIKQSDRLESFWFQLVRRILEKRNISKQKRKIYKVYGKKTGKHYTANFSIHTFHNILNILFFFLLQNEMTKLKTDYQF